MDSQMPIVTMNDNHVVMGCRHGYLIAVEHVHVLDTLSYCSVLIPRKVRSHVLEEHLLPENILFD